tara:strand:- start:20081 stop:20461 length:381 start_codon:yes stop_codon:yes gene_type:complete
MFNTAILIGNLGRDAEVKQTDKGTVANFSIATSEKWTNKSGEKEERTEWHRIVLWGKVAENLGQYLTKGKQVAVEGSIQSRKWTDKDGNERTTVEIIARKLTLLGGGAPAQRENVPSRDIHDDPPF